MSTAPTASCIRSGAPDRRAAASSSSITWDDALGEIATRLHAVIDTHGAEAILPFSDAGNQSVLALQGVSGRFFNHLGASRLVRAICGPTVGAGVAMTNGSGLGMDPLEIRHAKLIILWATNTKLTNRHLWPTIEEARADGAKIVVIDPIRTATAEAADWFLQPRPGTDIAMMLAMMHVLIRDGLVDDAWVAEHTTGFDELAESVAVWTPERAATATGLAPSDIEALAREYGTTRPVAIRTLIGGEHHENGAMFYRTLACLPALVGAWSDRGGGLARSVGSWQSLLVDDDALDRPDLLGDRNPRWFNMSRLGEVLTDVRSACARDDRVELQPAGDRAERRADEARPRARRPVHDRPRAVPHRHGPVRRHRAPGDHADRGDRRGDGMGAPVDGLERGGDRPARRIGQQQRAVPPDRASDGARPSHRCTTTTRRSFANHSRPSISTPCVAMGGSACRIPRTAGHGGTASSRRRPAGSSWPVTASSTSANRASRPTSRHAKVPTVTRRWPHGSRSSCSHRSTTPASSTRATRRSRSTGRSKVRRSSSCIRSTPRSAASPTATAHAVWNDRASVEVPVRISDRLRPGVTAIPFGWWMRQHPDGKVANSLTNDTLTEWGGGVAYSDTLVQIERAHAG